MTKNLIAPRIPTKHLMYELAGKRMLGGELNMFDYVINYYKVSDHWRQCMENHDMTQVELAINPTYHNVFHTKLVVLSALEGALCTAGGFTDKQIRVLLIAAMFHDACHLQGEPFIRGYEPFSDEHNLDRAVGAFMKADTALVKSNQKATPEEYKMIITMIRWTIYPRKQYIEPTDLGKILLDADLMSVAYCQDTKLRILLTRGLFNEMSIRKSDDYNNRTFYNEQQTFARSAKWFTRWATLKTLSHDWPGIFRKTYF